MSSIYSHAKLTIIAAVDSANDLLPRWNHCHHEVPAPIEMLSDVAYTTGNRQLVPALKATTWNRRGWTFQEGLVARKALVFTSESVYWNCREESWCEYQYTEFLDVRNEPSADTSLFATRLSRSTCDRSTGFTTQALCPMGLYAQHAQAYS